MKRLAVAMLSGLWATAALAGSGTVTVKDSTGTTQTFDVITDGSGHFVSMVGICDQSAAANCAGVGSDHGLSVDPGTAANWGVGATGSSVPANGPYIAGDAQSSEPSKATTGNLTGAFFDLAGKLVTSPYANRENYARGYVALSGTSPGTILAASGSASLKEYITDLTCTRSDTGTSAVSITLNDTASTVFDLPNNGGGGGFTHSYNVPLAFAANTAATATSGSSITTIHCHSTGYYGY